MEARKRLEETSKDKLLKQSALFLDLLGVHGYTGPSSGSRARSEAMTYRFGPYELNTQTGELRKSGVRVRLGGQPIEVLTLLVQRAGELVTRDELKEALWKEDTFTDFDHGVNTAVQRIRRALDDSATEPKFIETLPRRGYRFVAEVEAVADPQKSPARLVLVAGCGVLVAASIAWLVTRDSGGKAAVLEADTLGQSPLTNYNGLESYPNLSPDGSQVAFSWDGDGADNTDIYIKLVDASSDAPTRLTDHPAMDISPAWSPNAAQIAFLRAKDQNAVAAEVVLRPARGPGPELKLYETAALRDLAPGAPCSEIAWSPDGKWLAFSDRAEQGEPVRILLLSLETRHIRWLTSPQESAIGDNAPAFSPDGKAIAFVRRIGFSSGHEIYVLELDEKNQPKSPARRLTEFNRFARCPAWSPDGSEVLFLGGASPGQTGLWAVSPSGNSPPRFVRALSNKDSPSVSGLTVARASFGGKARLVYALDLSQSDVWQVHTGGPKAGMGRPLIATTTGEGHAHFSPDGNRVVFSSNRSGNAEIWVADRDGNEAWQLTDLGAQISGFPGWSPDSRRIVFHSRPGGQADIYVVDSDGGAPRRLTEQTTDETMASWSHDGRWIYYVRWLGGKREIWRMPDDGGEAERMTGRSGVRPLESGDGKQVYFVDADTFDLWAIPLNQAGQRAGPDERLASGPIHYNYAVTSEGLYYQNSKTSLVSFWSAETGESRPMFRIDGRPSGISPDGRILLYGRSEKARDLMLLENLP